LLNSGELEKIFKKWKVQFVPFKTADE